MLGDQDADAVRVAGWKVPHQNPSGSPQRNTSEGCTSSGSWNELERQGEDKEGVVFSSLLLRLGLTAAGEESPAARLCALAVQFNTGSTRETGTVLAQSAVSCAYLAAFSQPFCAANIKAEVATPGGFSFLASHMERGAEWLRCRGGCEGTAGPTMRATPAVEGIKQLNTLPGLSENPSAVRLLKVEEQQVPIATSTVHHHQYQMNRDAMIPIHKMICELESQGVVSKAHSPFNSPIWPVRKSDGEWRLTVDYRVLNEVTPPLSAAVPDMLELQYELESKAARCYATIDIANAFFSIPLAAEGRPQFAFTWRGMQYTWKQLPAFSTKIVMI
ncbi:hypothetical protein TURU_123303 [Turdus rufiventris]|nr:hypothetical protein TURU_123303 [Turdus rufiventris]